MEISPGKSKPNAGKASGKMPLQKILYCGRLFVALVCIALSISASAQEDRPQITPGERKAPRKKDAGPRAIGVVQIAANGKASLVPIAILVGGKFWDATAYKANPIPMALESGTVYEAERAGSSLGLFTVNGALHSNSANTQARWIGTGAWVPAGTEKPSAALKAEAVPVGINTTDEPPRLTRGGNEPKPTSPPSTTPPSTPPSTTPANTSGGPAGSGQTNPQSGSNPTSTSSGPPSSSPAGQGDAKSDSKPADAKPGEAKAPDPPAAPQSDSGASEANRPRLRRGKPVDPLPEDEVPGYSKPGATASTTSASSSGQGNAGKAPEQTADKTPVQLVPAISDASGPELKSFAFEWLKDEEGERLQQMTALAKEQVRAYVDAQARAKMVPAPKSSRAQATGRTLPSKTLPKGKEPILENVKMKTYDLWNNNQPVMVFTAEAHISPPPEGSPHGADSELQYSILLAANPDIYNNLHKLYVGITDKYHLDIRPRLELVDAVDADGDSRGELLFRQTSDIASGWVIYRATADRLSKLFDSLNPE